MERLGLPDPREFYILSDKEKEIDALKKEIIFHNSRAEKEPALEKLQRLEEIVGKDDRFMYQFILRTRTLLMPFNFEEKLAMLDEAIRITVPQFNIKKIGRHLYCIEEIKIISQMASIYGQKGEHRISLGLFGQLTDYVEERFPYKIHSGGYLPMITHNYAIELGRCKLYDDSIEMAERCRNYCIEYGYGESLPGAVAIMAENYFFKGDYEESKELYKCAYYGYKMMKNERAVKRLAAEVSEHYGEHFEF